MRFVRLEYPRAHHRRERERDKTRHHYRGGHGERELGEQLSGAAGHEGERRKHRGERQAHRDHREGDLARAVDRSLHRRLAHLHMAVAILQHHDRVVDDQANGEHQAEERQHVDGESHQEQKEERADQRHRYGDERNQRRANRAQEHEDHQHHQDHCLDHGAVDALDRALDEQRRVECKLQRHALRQPGLHALHFALDGLRHRERIGGGLLDDAQAHRGIAVHAHQVALVERAQPRRADVLEAHRIAARLGEDHVVELLLAPQVRLGKHGELALRDSIRPDGISTFWRRRADSTSCGVRPNAASRSPGRSTGASRIAARRR